MNPAARPSSASSLLNPQTPPLLPDAPMLESAVFESPLGPAIVLVAVGLAAGYTLRRAGRGRAAAWCAGVLMLAAAACVLTARLVTTDRERAMDATRELVAAVARADADAAGTHIAPDELGGLGVVLLGQRTGLDRAAVLSRIGTDLAGRYAVKDGRATLGGLRAEQTGPDAVRTQVRVTVTPEAFAFPTSSWWLMQWRRDRRDPQRWLLTGLEMQQLDGVPAGTRLDP